VVIGEVERGEAAIVKATLGPPALERLKKMDGPASGLENPPRDGCEGGNRQGYLWTARPLAERPVYVARPALGQWKGPPRDERARLGSETPRDGWEGGGSLGMGWKTDPCPGHFQV